MANILSQDIESWRQILTDFAADTKWREFYDREDIKRGPALGAMVDQLNRFLNCGIAVERFRADFDSKTRTEWDSFGFKGMSGAMFLNKLVKHISDQQDLTDQLHCVLAVPSSEDEASLQFGNFIAYLNGQIATGKATKTQLQPARASFFVSAWWHLQDAENWPVYYQSGRRSLELKGCFTETGDPIKDYLAFRKEFIALAHFLGLSSWKCEHLLDWYQKQPTESGGRFSPGSANGKAGKKSATLPDDTSLPPPEDDDTDDDSAISHTQIQWLLAKIGQKFDYKVWIASNDRSKVWEGQSLGALSIDSLPNLGLETSSQKIISLIDVVWLTGTKQIAAAFEIEHTTSIYSGLLRMADLVAMSPNLNFPLYLVAPETRLKKVRLELSRPTFQTLELHKRCGYFSDEALVQAGKAILQWASDISVINQLAQTVEDVEL